MYRFIDIEFYVYKLRHEDQKFEIQSHDNIKIKYLTKFKINYRRNVGKNIDKIEHENSKLHIYILKNKSIPK